MNLSGRLDVLGSTAVSMRVERPDGSLAALTTSSAGGEWSVDVPPGDYVVRPRWMDPFTISTATSTSAERPTPTSEDMMRTLRRHRDRQRGRDI